MPSALQSDNFKFASQMLCAQDAAQGWQQLRATGRMPALPAQPQCTADPKVLKDLSCMMMGGRLPTAITPDGQVSEHPRDIPALMRAGLSVATSPSSAAATPVAQLQPAPATASKPSLAALTGSWTAVTADDRAKPVPWSRGARCGPFSQGIFMMIGVPPGFFGRLIDGSPSGPNVVSLEIISNLVDNTAVRDRFGYGGVNMTFAGELQESAMAGHLPEINFSRFSDASGRNGAGELDRRTGAIRPPVVVPNDGIQLAILSVEANVMKVAAKWQSPCERELTFHRTRVIRGIPERVVQ